jgi:hypothetical protein
MFGGACFNASTATQPSASDIIEASKKFRKIGDKLKASRLEMQSRMTERTKCPECGRSITFTDDGAYMCQHMIDKLKELPESDGPATTAWDRICGIRVEVYPF